MLSIEYILKLYFVFWYFIIEKRHICVKNKIKMLKFIISFSNIFFLPYMEILDDYMGHEPCIF